jgi:cytochrome P450
MLATLVAAKRAAPGDDLVTALISARNGAERLTEQELRSTIFQLIAAGHDTRASLLGNGTVALLRHPAELAALRDDPRRLPHTVEELLRYTRSPTQRSAMRPSPWRSPGW